MWSIKFKKKWGIKSGIIIKIIFFLLISLIITIFPKELYGDSWLKADSNSGDKIWIDTSHWEMKKILVQDGYFRETAKKRWIDTSYIIKQGHWETGQYPVWVVSEKYIPVIAYKWIDTSRYEVRSREVEVKQLVNFTIIEGTNNYGWNVYSFASKSKGLQLTTYKGEKYYAWKWVIDYQPYMGGRIYAVKWNFIIKVTKVRQNYTIFVKSGFWQSYKIYKLIDDSHWEMRTGVHWVDTSYKVTQGYWEEYFDKEWVNTNYYENKKVWIKDGHFDAPLHGEVIIEKNPGYIFTEWHKNEDGGNCGMNLKISWKLDNNNTTENEEIKKISSINIFENLVRYNNKGIEKIVVFDKHIVPAEEGQIETNTFFEYPGNDDSILHIYLLGENGESVHLFFNNPINGYRSINLSSKGTNSSPASWLGGNKYGKIEF